MNTKSWFTGIAMAMGLVLANNAAAHFQMIIPSNDMAAKPSERQINLDVRFWHPFEGHGMDMEKPAKFGVMLGKENTDLLGTLSEQHYTGLDGAKHKGYKSSYAMKKPGNYIFYVEPKPYWEPSEDTFIVHYTKVVVNGFGLDEGWDQEVGLKTEIVPLTRPYGLYAGNIFQGIVKLDGKPLPNVDVEVEYYNQDGKAKAPADTMITQVVRSDVNGVFTYAMPRAGWWGFAALTTADKPMKKDGKEYPVEQGAVIWVKTYPVK